MLVLASEATVTIEFYLLLLPLLAWSGAHMLVVCLTGAMALQSYAVFGAKDLLESPRPADCLKAVSVSSGAAESVHNGGSGGLHLHRQAGAKAAAAAGTPSVVVRDTSGEVEDGLPSAHVSGSLLLLLYLAEAMACGAGTDWYVCTATRAAAVAWVSWVALGRAYLGVHSPLDLGGGCAAGAALLAAWRAVEPGYMRWLQAGAPGVTFVVALLSFAGMRFFPAASRPTAAYGYHTAWWGGWAGVVLGWCSTASLAGGGGSGSGSGGGSGGAAGPVVALLALSAGGDRAAAYRAAGALLAKVVLGLAALAVARAATRCCARTVLGAAFSMVPHGLRASWQPPAASTRSQPGGPRGASALLKVATDGTPLDVAVTARFLSYAAVGAMVFLWDTCVWPHLAGQILLQRLDFASSVA
jgi:membrane-associated phospholipid phosphatase